MYFKMWNKWFEKTTFLFLKTKTKWEQNFCLIFLPLLFYLHVLGGKYLYKQDSKDSKVRLRNKWQQLDKFLMNAWWLSCDCLEAKKWQHWQMFLSSHFSFLVFGHFWQQSYENTKICLVNSVYILQGKMGKTEKEWEENHETKVTKIPKTKRRKYWMNKTKDKDSFSCFWGCLQLSAA